MNIDTLIADLERALALPITKGNEAYERIATPDNIAALLAKLANELGQAIGATPAHSDESMLRLPDVERVIGLSRSKIYQLVRSGDFPQPTKLGPKYSGWFASEVQQWIQEKVATAPRGVGKGPRS